MDLALEMKSALDAGDSAQVQFVRTQTDGLSFGIFDSISPKISRQGRAEPLWEKVKITALIKMTNSFSHRKFAVKRREATK